MSSLSRLPKLAAIAGASSALILSSCALPPEQAWRKIRTDGLISYIAYEIRTPRRAAPQTTPAVPQPVKAPGVPGKPEALLATTSAAPAPAPVVPSTPSGPSSLSLPVLSDSTPVAVAVPSLPGYVRSPFTNPPRLVDVKGAAPGTKVVCPYSNKPFIVPAAAVQENNTPALAEKKETPARTKTPEVAATKEPATPAPTKTGKVETPAQKEPAPEASASPKKLAGNDKPVAPPKEPAAPVTPPPAPSVEPAPEIPYGSPIVGRPGFVNSPYAAAHQLVDVTGLPTGMEVKCPYTGKLFRVPPQDMASSKPVEIPAEKK